MDKYPDRVEELNERIQTRHFPDLPLQPNFDPRPVATKYAVFPVVNPRKTATVPLRYEIHHQVPFHFNPGTQNAPPSGYFANVDDETLLRNQIYPLEHGLQEHVYIPSSKSELYVDYLAAKKSGSAAANPVVDHPLLFSKDSFQTQQPTYLASLGHDTFANHTRTQSRAMKPVFSR